MKDCGDSARYAYNTANLRDALILSVIRDIDGWYEMAAADLCAASEVPIARGAMKEKRNHPMEVLFRVDEILWENLCRSEPETIVDFQTRVRKDLKEARLKAIYKET